MRDLISVIVPCYNVEDFLPRCLESLISQSYHNIEIILVDDGSSDRCGEICDDYAAKDSRIRVIHKKNGGLSDARNVAIDIAKGDYLTFVDSDDYVCTDYVETLYDLCVKYETKMAVADWLIYPMGDIPILPHRKIKEILFSRQKALECMFNQVHFDVSACVKLYHRSLFDGVRYPKGMLFEDLQTTFKCILNCDNGVAYSNKQIYYYMFRPNSIEGSEFSERKMDSAIEVFNVMNSYEEELKDVADALKSKLTAFCFHLLLKAPKSYKRGEILYDYIKKVRWSVITNPNARLKNRIGCIATYIGFDFTRWLFRWVDRRRI
jgi:glycosyltransferase involved in cell wall biosynthesis